MGVRGLPASDRWQPLPDGSEEGQAVPLHPRDRGRKAVQEFSSGRFRQDLDEHIRQCAEECLAAHKRGRWTLSTATSSSSLMEDMGWFELAERARANLRARVAREGSRKNAEGHLTEIGKIRGPITVNRLKKWALERDPIAQPSAFRESTRDPVPHGQGWRPGPQATDRRAEGQAAHRCRQEGAGAAHNRSASSPTI